MIAFYTWLSQIIGYCELIIDESALRWAWIDHDASITSVTDFDELYEQIFDDLDSGSFQTELPNHLPDDDETCAALINFLESLRRMDQTMTERGTLLDPKTLLESAQWQAVRRSALAVLRAMGRTADGTS